MTRFRLVCALVFAVFSGVLAPASAQTPAPQSPMLPPPAAAPVGMGKNVQIDLTIKLDGTGPGLSKRMTLVSADGTVAMGRAGLEIPVQMAAGNTQYRSVGLNVDARPRIFEGTRVALMLKLEFSSVLKGAATSGAPGSPSFASAKTELNMVLDSGKPLVISQAGDGEVDRGYTVEVKATVLR